MHAKINMHYNYHFYHMLLRTKWVHYFYITSSSFLTINIQINEVRTVKLHHILHDFIRRKSVTIEMASNKYISGNLTHNKESFISKKVNHPLLEKERKIYWWISNQREINQMLFILVVIYYICLLYWEKKGRYSELCTLFNFNFIKRK